MARANINLEKSQLAKRTNRKQTVNSRHSSLPSNYQESFAAIDINQLTTTELDYLGSHQAALERFSVITGKALLFPAEALIGMEMTFSGSGKNRLGTNRRNCGQSSNALS